MMKPLRYEKPVVALVLATLAGLGVTGDAAGQSALERTPNLSGGWVGTPGALHFNFLHRFNLIDTPSESVVDNSPTFLLAAPLPGRTLVGAHYASASRLAVVNENEWELFGRWAPLATGDGHPVDLALTAAYNDAAESADGELSVGLPFGPARILGIARTFSDQAGRGDGGFAFGGGAAVRITDHLAVAGDVVSASDLPDTRTTAWGAAIQLAIPTTPHTVSFQATNTRTGTLQSSSEGFREDPNGDSRITWGFEFTIPFTFSRYFGGGRGGEPMDAERAPEGESVTVEMEDLRFAPEALRIRSGQTVFWRNTSPLVHTVTADPDASSGPNGVRLPDGAATFDSGNVRSGEIFAQTFTVPGEYAYICVPHEAAGMVGTIIVEP